MNVDKLFNMVVIYFWLIVFRLKNGGIWYGIFYNDVNIVWFFYLDGSWKNLILCKKKCLYDVNIINGNGKWKKIESFCK